MQKADVNAQQLIQHYDQMIAVLKEQQSILGQSKEDDDLNALVLLSNQWNELSENIRLLEEQSSGIEQLSQDAKQTIISMLQQLQGLQLDISAKLEAINDSMVNSMGRVKKQQTVIRGYGLMYQDSTAMYFDEKN